MLLHLADGVRHRINRKGPLHPVVVHAAADDVALAGRPLHESHIAALPPREEPAGNRPLIVIPAFRLVRGSRCGADEATDDGLSVDVFQIQLVLAFQRRIGVDEHVSLEIEDKDVFLFVSPTAARTTELAKRRFALCADQLSRVSHELNKVTGLRMLVNSLRVAVERQQQDRSRKT